MTRYYHNSMLEPWQQLFQEMNRVFEDWPKAKGWSGTNYPQVNIWSTENDTVLTAELPGINPEAIDINVIQDVITIRGERKAAMDDKSEYRRQERPLGSFQRSFKLPYRIDAEKVEAKYEKGILTIKMPRSEHDKPKQIKVTSH